MFSSTRTSRRDVGLLKIFLVPSYFGHLVTMWSIERFSLHTSNTGVGSLETRVRCVWPILIWVIITSFLLFRFRGKIHFLMEGLIFLNLFVRGTSLQFFCHVSRILRLMVTNASGEVVRLSLRVLWGTVANMTILLYSNN